MVIKIGILALQGGFDLHSKRVVDLGAEPRLIRQEGELNGIDALIIPGGESTTLLKLCTPAFRKKIRGLIKDGLPTLTTCAGTILLASKVTNPEQESLNLIPIEVERNAYGRQTDSFITKDLELTGELKNKEVEAVFIRAPKLSPQSNKVEILIRHRGDPVLVRSGNILAATFHPELSPSAKAVHELFLQSIVENVTAH